MCLIFRQLTFRRSYTSHCRHCHKRIAADSTKILRPTADPGRGDVAATAHRHWPPRHQRSPNTPPTTTQQRFGRSMCPCDLSRPAAVLAIAARRPRQHNGLQSFQIGRPRTRNRQWKSLLRNGGSRLPKMPLDDDLARPIAFLIREKFPLLLILDRSLWPNWRIIIS